MYISRPSALLLLSPSNIQISNTLPLPCSPVLQVVGFPRSATSTPRFGLVLSDGVHVLLGLLDSGLAHFVTIGVLRRGTVLRLLQYHCNTIGNRSDWKSQTL
nr:replication protein A 70 kDa DNA-binding subunit C-like [Setaria viridis]